MSYAAVLRQGMADFAIFADVFATCPRKKRDVFEEDLRLEAHLFIPVRHG